MSFEFKFNAAAGLVEQRRWRVRERQTDRKKGQIQIAASKVVAIKLSKLILAFPTN